VHISAAGASPEYRRIQSRYRDTRAPG